MARRRPGLRPDLQDDQEFVDTSNPQRRAMLLAHAAQSGVKRVRVNVAYSRTKGGTDFAPYDAAVEAIRKAGMKPQFTMMADPEYGGNVYGVGDKVGSKLSASHSDPAEMARWVAATAKHFKGRVDRYELGNEPNHPAFLRSTNPREYRRLLDAGIMGLKSVDPHAQVLAGGLMPHNALPWLRKMVGKRALAVDGISIHPYGERGKAHRSAHGAGIADLQHVQRVLGSLARQGKLTAANGRGRTDLYLTEDGTQASTGSTRARVRESARRVGNAQRAGARQYVQYQATPKFAKWDTSLPIGSLAARLQRAGQRR